MTSRLAAISLSFPLAIAACKKAEQPAAINQEFYGLKLAWPKLTTEFTNASPEIQASAALAAHSFRCADFPRALAELDKLSNLTGLTEPNRKVVSELLEQTRLVMAKALPSN